MAALVAAMGLTWVAWARVAPELARSRDYFTGIEVGGVVSGSTLLSRCLTTAPRESTCRRHWRSGPRAYSCEMSASLNPLVSPHPPSLRRHLSTLSADFREATKREIISLSLGRQGPALRGSLP